MTFVWILTGLLLPTCSGWLLVRLCEGRTPVLFRLERWVLGFLFGVTGTMFVIFLAHIAGFILFTRMGFLSVESTLTLLLLIFRLIQWHLLPSPNPNPNPSPNPTPLPQSEVRPVPRSLACQPKPRRRLGEGGCPKSVSILLILLALWTLAKIAFGSFILVTTPSYFDDTLKNWNYRAKVFTVTHTLDVGSAEQINPLSSYPPTVSLFKASLASFAGQWNEGLVNGVHALWLLAALILLFCALRHRTEWQWALFGTYLLASLPLYLFDGVNAYADVYCSAHLVAAGSLLLSGLTETDAGRRRSFLRLSALAIGLLIFTKNEALILFAPLLLALFAGGLLFLAAKNRMTRRDILVSLAWMAGWLLSIALPWMLFKWTHGLGFGNAKNISSSYAFGWQPNVPTAIWISTFFEGNWHLLFPLLFLLLAIERKRLFQSVRTPLVLLILATLSVQLALYCFTSLSVEALQQTGLGRGFVQIVPLIVLLVTLLMREGLREKD